MTETILPYELPDSLNRVADGVKILSLDCFDTLLWRDCHAPTDLFAGLPDLNTGQRIVAETQARKQARILHGRSEVGLSDIYAQAMPNAANEVRDAAIAAELALEAQTCFAFHPTVKLMREAKLRGLSVMIVSDTYLDARQLRELIARAAGEEVSGLIDHVFASSQEGVSKSQGLLAKALNAVKHRPHEVVHIGDNLKADYDSARALGIPALHLKQFDSKTRQRLRFERSCQQVIGEGRGCVNGLQPHRALTSQDVPQLADPAKTLGYTVLGPVFQAFDKWLQREAEALAQSHGGKIHWLFMLRDGHLPHIVHQAAQHGDEGGADTAPVEISRFAAIGASLTSRAAYEKQYALELGLNPVTLARQMLLDEDEITDIVGNCDGEVEMQAGSARLLKELKTGQRQKVTRRRSRQRADRLIAHVRAACNPQAGDTLMLVDLGYNGSAQDRVDALLSEAFDVHVAGRYLLLREMAATGLDKAGLIDARHFDPALLEAMCGNVAVIEQLSTCELGSVTDYTEGGDPVRKASVMKGGQSDVRDRVQQGAVQFASAAQQSPAIRVSDPDVERGWRDAAASVLMRFMFLPQPHELAVLKEFEHDVNLGSERMVGLFDPDQAKDGMKRRGLFYMKGASRMFLPAELAREDMNTRIALMTHKRFGLGLTYNDTTSEPIAIPAVYLGAKDTAQTTIMAQPTHQGYYVARLPVSDHANGMALQVGAVFEWFELAGITACPVTALKGGNANDATPRDCVAQFDGLVAHSPEIYECNDPAAFVLVNRPHCPDGTGQQMVEIVFRPLRFRAVPFGRFRNS